MSSKNDFYSDYYTYIEKYRMYEFRDPEDILNEIVTECNYMDSHDKEKIIHSYQLAKKWHNNQLRQSGTAFITHTLTVARLMIPYRPSSNLISAGILHDIIEDTETSLGDIRKIDPEIATLVDGVTKIVPDEYTNSQEENINKARFETIRKIFKTSEKNIGIIYLKLFDRLHNMMTIQSLTEEKKNRITRETSAIFTPLAKRMWLRFIHQVFQAITEEVTNKIQWDNQFHFFQKNKAQMEINIAKIINNLSEYIPKKYSITYTFLSPFSIKNEEKNDINAWYAIQIIVEKKDDCYDVLRTIYKNIWKKWVIEWSELDMIIHSRLSGYQWIHIKIFDTTNKKIIIHILNQETYDKMSTTPNLEYLGNTYSQVLFHDFPMIDAISDNHSELFYNSISQALLSRKILLTSRKKNNFYLPIESTILDAIIYLEPEIFYKITNVYANNLLTSLNTKLSENDRIDYDIGDATTIDTNWKFYTKSWFSQWKIDNYINKK